MRVEFAIKPHNMESFAYVTVMMMTSNLDWFYFAIVSVTFPKWIDQYYLTR